MRNVTLRRLEVFVAVAEAGSFTAAADRLGIAQPSVSAHIQYLEDHFRGALFLRRRGSSPLLTELGRVCLEQARQLLSQATEMSQRAQGLRGEGERRVVFACQRSLANYVFRDELVAFAREHPEIQLVVWVGVQEEVLEHVQSGAADIGCCLANDPLPRLDSQVVRRERLVFIASSAHPLARRRRVRPGDLAAEDFVAPAQSSMFGRSLSRLLAGIGIDGIRVAAQATEYGFLRGLVAAGVGISCSLEKSVAEDIRSGVLTRLDVDAPDLWMSVRVLRSPGRPVPPHVNAFTSFLFGRQAEAPAA